MIRFVRDSAVLWAPTTCTDDSMGEDLRVRHVPGADSIWDLIGYGFFWRYDWIVLDVTCQMVVLSVLPYSHGYCILRLSLL